MVAFQYHPFKILGIAFQHASLMINLVVFVRILSIILVSFDLSFGAIKAASQGDQEEAKKIMLSQ